MPRRKVKLEFIEDKKRRTTTFKKRIAGLKKKANELATLCDIPVLFVCYGPEGKIFTWPEDSNAVRDVITKDLSLSKEEQQRNMFHLRDFINAEINKFKAKLQQQDPQKLSDSEVEEVKKYIAVENHTQTSNALEERPFTSLQDNAVRDIIVKYQGLSKEEQQCHTLDLLGFFNAEINKLKAKLQQLQDPSEIVQVLDSKTEEIKKRIAVLKGQKCLENEDESSMSSENHTESTNALEERSFTSLQDYSQYGLNCSSNMFNLCNAMIPVQEPNPQFVPENWHGSGSNNSNALPYFDPFMPSSLVPPYHQSIIHYHSVDMNVEAPVNLNGLPENTPDIGVPQNNV